MKFLNFLFIYFLYRLKTAVSAYYFELNKTTRFTFLAAVLNATDSRLISTAVVISPYWVLTVAHLLPPDTYGLNPRHFLVMAGNPAEIQKPTFVITHPTYSCIAYTAEDLALFRLPTQINSEPIGVNFGRFSSEMMRCDFMYLSQASRNSKSLFIGIIPVETMILEMCFLLKRKSSSEIALYYIDSLLCSIFDGKRNLSVGETSGFLLCNKRLTGFLIKKNWTSGIAANFTDVGVFGNWLSSRVENIKFIPTMNPEKDLSSPKLFLNIYFFLLIYLFTLKLI